MTDNNNNQTNSTELFDQIHQRDIGEEMRNSYIDYAISCGIPDNYFMKKNRHTLQRIFK